MDNQTAKTFILWRSILGIVMVCAGCACFVLSCIASMVLSRD